MGLFSPSPNQKPSSKAPASKAEQTFQRHGGKIHTRHFDFYLRRTALPPYKRQHFQDIVQKHNLEDRDWFRRSYVSKDEFFKALDEAVKDPHDSINRDDADRIKRTFS